LQNSPKLLDSIVPGSLEKWGAHLHIINDNMIGLFRVKLSRDNLLQVNG